MPPARKKPAKGLPPGLAKYEAAKAAKGGTTAAPSGTPAAKTAVTNPKPGTPAAKAPAAKGPVTPPMKPAAKKKKPS